VDFWVRAFSPLGDNEILLLPASVQDHVPADHLSRFIVALVRQNFDLSKLFGSYTSGLGQPPLDPRMMTALLLTGYASGSIFRGALPRLARSAPTS
jgi:transposase